MPFPAVVRERAIAFVPALAILAVFATGGATVAAQPSDRLPRVRPDNALIATTIARATGQSVTFRALIDAIDATDGLVYVEEGRCRRGVRACLSLSLVIAGPHRVLRILVDPRKSPGCELAMSIGHELQHALEVLSNVHVRSSSQMFHFVH
jgi:hypothetical protein